MTGKPGPRRAVDEGRGTDEAEHESAPYLRQVIEGLPQLV